MRSAVSAAVREWVIRMPAPALALICCAQQRQDLRRAARVEIAGGLIGEHQPRPVHQRACDGDALHLAAGQFARVPRGEGAMPTAVSISSVRRLRSGSGIAQQSSGRATFCSTLR